jgi:hypothetical protein
MKMAALNDNRLNPRFLSRRPSFMTLNRRELVAGLACALTACTDDTSTAGVPAQPISHKAELLRVGPGQEYASLTLAGCRLQVKWTDGGGHPLANPEPAHVIISPAEPGYYVNDSGSHSRRWPQMVGWPPYEGNLYGPVVIEGEPGKPAPDLVTDGYGDGVLYYQAGLFITTGFDTVFRHLHFSGFRRQDGGGTYCAIRFNPHEGKKASVLLEDVEIDHCDDGILGGDVDLTLTLRRSYFHDNGNNTGLCHNIYMSNGGTLIAEDILSTRCTLGHLLKSRAAHTIIRNCRLLGQGGTESACLDVPDAGILEIDGLICEKSPGTDAGWIIHYAGENQDGGNGVPFHVPSSVKIRDLTMVAPTELTRHPGWLPILEGFANQSGLGETQSGAGSYLVEPDASAVKVFALTRHQAGLPGATVLEAAPVLDVRPPT